ncbi:MULTISPECIES: hypothetical protein [unclassified Kitasatospora]|uniref:hypothetical protein n=1 Tax=unclassified Kitasatospora TaxID=2633591 RepID=UPI0037FAAA5E
MISKKGTARAHLRAVCRVAPEHLPAVGGGLLDLRLKKSRTRGGSGVAGFGDVRVPPQADAGQITANYAEREPEYGIQTHRAEVSTRFSHWLSNQARRHALPVIDCRPWDNLPNRLHTAG